MPASLHTEYACVRPLAGILPGSGCKLPLIIPKTHQYTGAQSQAATPFICYRACAYVHVLPTQ